MNFGEVLSKAWQIIWKHKVLWIFGILAGLLGSGSNNLSYTLNDANPNNLPPAIQEYTQSPEQMIPLVILGILVGLVLLVLVIFLGTIGRIGLIRGTQMADSGSSRLVLGELFSGSMPYFWRVFFLNLLFGLAVSAFVIILVLGAIFGSILTLGLGLICLVPLCCLMIPVFWAVNIFLEQANIAIVVENVGIWEGLSQGWKVFSSNLGVMIGMGLILWLISLATGLLIGIPLIFTLAPVVTTALWQAEDLFRGSVIFGVVCFCLYLPVLIFLTGILTAYIKSAWTLMYLRLTKQGQPIMADDIPLPPAEESTAQPEVL
jgi:hypothetical protein